jgi:hypothetical protein
VPESKSTKSLGKKLLKLLAPHPQVIETIGEVETSVLGVSRSQVVVHLGEPLSKGSHRVVVLELRSSMPDTPISFAYLSPFETRQLAELLTKASKVRVATSHQP